MINKNSRFVALTALGLLTLGSSALAQPRGLAAPVQSGVYLSPNLGYGQANVDSGSFSGGKDTFVANPQVGYQFNRWVAFELGYANFASISGSVTAGSAAPTTLVKVANHYFDLAVKAMYPLPRHFQIFGKAGVARVTSKYSSNISSASGTSVVTASGSYDKSLLFLGAGIGYHVNRTMEVSLQASSTPSSYAVPSLFATTIGFSHTFAM